MREREIKKVSENQWEVSYLGVSRGYVIRTDTRVYDPRIVRHINGNRCVIFLEDRSTLLEAVGSILQSEDERC